MNKQLWGWKGSQALQERKPLQWRARVSAANADGRYPNLAAFGLNYHGSNAVQFMPSLLRV